MGTAKGSPRAREHEGSDDGQAAVSPPGHPQSTGQVFTVSAVQIPSPHQQSPGQVASVSAPAWQKPSPHPRWQEPMQESDSEETWATGHVRTAWTA